MYVRRKSEYKRNCIAWAMISVSLAALCLPSELAAQEQRQDIDKITAAFVFKFASYVEWPSNAFEDKDEPIVIGALGSSAVGAILSDTFEGKKSGGRRVIVRVPLRDDEVQDCHILFISETNAEDTRLAVESVGRNHVLTVSRAPQFARNGGIIQLYLVDNKVRFEINVDAADRAGLKISSKLLGLAKVVHDKQSDAE